MFPGPERRSNEDIMQYIDKLHSSNKIRLTISTGTLVAFAIWIVVSIFGLQKDYAVLLGKIDYIDYKIDQIRK